MKYRIGCFVLFVCFMASAAFGQKSLYQNCNDSSSAAFGKLVCQFPYSVGLYTNDTALGSNYTTTPNAAVVATIFNSAIATQVSQLPVSTATSGTVLLYENGAYQTLHNQGPILTDRPQTVGRYHFFVGFSASQYVFNSIDGQSLGSLQFSYARSPSNQSSTTYTSETTKFSFRLKQFVAMATFGITDRLDVSAIIPIEKVSIGAGAPDPITPTPNVYSWVVSGASSFGPYQTTSQGTSGTASGVGDLVFNAKYLLWNGEQKSGSHLAQSNSSGSSGAGRSAISFGVNVREPFGDDLNMLGSGAWGVNPYLVASHTAAVSTHAKIGYQWNSATELNPEITSTTTISGSGTNTTQDAKKNQQLPGGFVEDIGADWAAHRRFTIAADILGNQYQNATVLSSATAIISLPSAAAAPGAGECTAGGTSAAPTLSCVSTTYKISSYNVTRLSTGVKWNPYRDFVISANVLTQLDHKGLHSRPVPLLGLSYKF